MAAAVRLRRDYSAVDLWALARRSGDASQVRRLLALAVIYAGGSRRDAALSGGVGLQTVRDWVLRFNARGPDGLIDGKAPGKVALLNAAQRQALAGVVEAGPELAVPGVKIGPGIRSNPAQALAELNVIRQRLLSGMNPYKAIQRD